MKLDIACGNNKQKGFEGIDISSDSQADKVHDLMQFPWPIEDNQVEEAFASHYLEHIPHGNGYNDPFFSFFNELYRIMKKGGKATFITPYYMSGRAFQDPTHNRYITEATYLYLDPKWRKANKLEHYPITAKFKVIGMDHGTDPQIVHGRSTEALQNMGLRYWNVINDLVVTIKKL